jgi:nucleoside-diphosphate-sugar epimerase
VWTKLAAGQPLALPDRGLGVLHHVHADDVAQAFERALTRPAAIGSSFHVVAEQAMTLRGLAAGVAAWFGREPELDFVDWAEFERRSGPGHAAATREHTVRSITASIDRARAVRAPLQHPAGTPRGADLAGRQRSGRCRRSTGLVLAITARSAERRLGGWWG